MNQDRCELCDAELLDPLTEVFVLGEDPPEDTGVDTTVCLGCCLSNIEEAETTCHSKQDALAFLKGE